MQYINKNVDTCAQNFYKMATVLDNILWLTSGTERH